MNNKHTTEPKIIIAIDGFSSSGKSTMAKALAKRIGYRYIDSGAMYRAVTLYALRNDMLNDTRALVASLPDIHIDFKIEEDGRQVTVLNGENVEALIRSMDVSSNVSQVATIPEVRNAMVAQQKAFGNEKGIVMDGRDICTVVFPDAELKIFVNASAEARAKRRFEELRQKGDDSTTFEQVLENIKFRDYTDTHRSESPMHIAAGAIVLDNSDMTIDMQNAFLDKAFINCIKALKQKGNA